MRQPGKTIQRKQFVFIDGGTTNLAAARIIPERLSTRTAFSIIVNASLQLRTKTCPASVSSTWRWSRLKIVNLTRFSSSAICLLRAGWLMAIRSAAREKFSSSDKTAAARRRRSPQITANTTSEVANHLRTNGTLLRQRALHRLDLRPIDPAPLAADDPHPVHQ
jgi:hypothetical protein